MTGPAGGFHSLAPAPVSTKNRFLLLGDQGRERRIGALLVDYVREPWPRRGRSAPATARAAILTSPHVSAITAYTPASQAPALLRSMAFSYTSLSLSSPATADGSPVPSDGSISPAPADGFAGFGGDSFGGAGTAALCAEFCCCHDEETVVLRFEKRAEIDKTNRIPDTSVAVNCCSFPIDDTCSTSIERLQDLFGFELSSFSSVSGEVFAED